MYSASTSAPRARWSSSAEMQSHPEALQLGLGPPERVLGVDGRPFDLGVGELEHHVVGARPRSPGSTWIDLHAAGGLGLDPSEFSGTSVPWPRTWRIEAPALDGTDPHGVAVDRRGGGLEAGHGHGHCSNRDDSRRGDQPPVAAFLFDDSGSNNIHYLLPIAA